MTTLSYRVSITFWMIITFTMFGIMTFAASAAEDPSVIARSYRPAPPPIKHYYPTTGVKPQIGRAEDLLAPSNASEPAKTYRRDY
jgi:hypothetical protein